MSDITRKVSAPAAQAEPIHRIWPQAIVTIGLGVTGAWMFFLGYGLVRLIELLI